MWPGFKPMSVCHSKLHAVFNISFHTVEKHEKGDYDGSGTSSQDGIAGYCSTSTFDLVITRDGLLDNGATDYNCFSQKYYTTGYGICRVCTPECLLV